MGSSFLLVKFYIVVIIHQVICVSVLCLCVQYYIVLLILMNTWYDNFVCMQMCSDIFVVNFWSVVKLLSQRSCWLGTH